MGAFASLTNWSMTRRSPCFVFKPLNVEEIMQSIALAHECGLTVIPHGAGHSFTDVALNTQGIIIDVSNMHHILTWDPQEGIMQVEPGVTLREVARVALADGWWPVVTPSSGEVTVGGCVALNVMGKNAWKCGTFGEHVLSITVMLASGQFLTLSPRDEPKLFQAFVGSAGLLGLFTSITLQLRRVSSEYLDIRVRPAASYTEVLAIFQEEQSSDFLEALVDGFAQGNRLGRGIVTCATYSAVDDPKHWSPPSSHKSDQIMIGLARCAGSICRPVVNNGVRIANRMIYRWGAMRGKDAKLQRSLMRSTFYSPAVCVGYQTLLPHGINSFQAFIPRQYATSLFGEILQRSQAQQLTPLLCIIKQHRPDPFLLSYQVDGFSIEAYFPIEQHTAHKLQKMLEELMYRVIETGGRFYFAKDALLTPDLYRQSIGDTAVDVFLSIKQKFDPEVLFQSDLFRRIFRPSTRASS